MCVCVCVCVLPPFASLLRIMACCCLCLVRLRCAVCILSVWTHITTQQVIHILLKIIIIILIVVLLYLIFKLLCNCYLINTITNYIINNNITIINIFIFFAINICFSFVLVMFCNSPRCTPADPHGKTQMPALLLYVVCLCVFVFVVIGDRHSVLVMILLYDSCFSLTVRVTAGPSPLTWA